MGALQRHGTRKPHWVPFPQAIRSRNSTEVERPISVSSWDGRFRVPVKSVPDWTVVCASEASDLASGEERPHVEHLLACLDVLLGRQLANTLVSGRCGHSTPHHSLSTWSVFSHQLLFDRLHFPVDTAARFGRAMVQLHHH